MRKTIQTLNNPYVVALVVSVSVAALWLAY